MSTLRQFARAATTVAVLATCEIGTHYAVGKPGAEGFGLLLVLAPLLAVAFAAAARSPHRAMLLPLWTLGCALLWSVHTPLARNFAYGAYLEQIALNLALAYLFGRTLAAGREPLCSQFARMVHGTLTPRIAQYTRQITAAWMLFFLSIAAISTLLFATSSLVTWSTFANYLTFPLVAAMFAGEHLWRRIALPDVESPGMLATARACRSTFEARGARIE